MAWHFETHPAFQNELDWIERFMRDHVEPLDHVLEPKLLHDIAGRALHLHESLGLSNELPFMHWVTESYFLALADGPTEVHKVTLAKQVLRGYDPATDTFPDYHLPRLRAAALERFAEDVESSEASFR